LVLALEAAGQAVYRSVLVRRATGLGIDRRQWSNVGPDWVGHQSLVVPNVFRRPDADVAGVWRELRTGFSITGHGILLRVLGRPMRR
jgi:hypothetical protein